MKLSIIVPVYNVEKYLEKCLSSILTSNINQENIEIIIVNDGSTDGSLEIASKFEKEYENIKLYTQVNGGLSSARNTGLSYCTGSFVWFVDSDDEVVSIDLLYDFLCKNSKLDFVGVKLKEIDSKGNFIRISCNQPDLVHNVLMSGRDAILNKYNPSSACALIMRRDFLMNNHLQFKIGITHEDVEFTYRSMSKAKHVIFTNFCPYIYYRRGDTMSTPHDNERLLKYLIDDISVALSFKKLAIEVKGDKELYGVISRRSSSVSFGILTSLISKRKELSSKGILLNVFNRMIENGLYPLRGPFYSRKQMLFSKMLNIKSVLLYLIQ